MSPSGSYCLLSTCLQIKGKMLISELLIAPSLFINCHAATAAKSLQSCLTLCDPIPGILQARTLEWVAISFSNA